MPALHEYIEMIRSAVQGQTTLVEFSTLFMEVFAADSQRFPEPVFDVLNSVLLDSDEFEPDPDLFTALKNSSPDFVLDGNEFSKRLSANLERLVGCA